MSIKKAVAVAGLALALTSAAVITSCNTESETPMDYSTIPLTPIVADGDGIQHAPAGAMAQTFNNVKYGKESRNVMGISVPDGDGPFPLLVWFYGGGFMGGHPQGGTPGGGKHVNPTTANAKGYVFAGPRYTVLNENGSNPSFPMIIEDALGAIRFLKANACKYKIDTTRVVVAGFSAGGYITNMVVALSNANHSFDNDRYENMHVSSKVHAGVSWAGLTDFGKIIEHNNDVVGMHNQLAGGLLGCSDLRQNCNTEIANPLTYVSANTPPLMMYHGTNDGTVPYKQSVILYEKFQSVAPGKAVYNEIPNGAHTDSTAVNANEAYNFFEAAIGTIAGNMNCDTDPDPDCATNPSAPGCNPQECNTQTQHCENSSSLGKYCTTDGACDKIEVGSPRCTVADIVDTESQCHTSSIREYERVIR